MSTTSRYKFPWSLLGCDELRQSHSLSWAATLITGSSHLTVWCPQSRCHWRLDDDMKPSFTSLVIVQVHSAPPNASVELTRWHRVPEKWMCQLVPINRLAPCSRYAHGEHHRCGRGEDVPRNPSLLPPDIHSPSPLIAFLTHTKLHPSSTVAMAFSHDQ